MIGGGLISTIILWLLILGGAALLLIYRERIASFTREVKVELITPVAMEKTMRFAIREGGKTVGAGRISEIVDAGGAK